VVIATATLVSVFARENLLEELALLATEESERLDTTQLQDRPFLNQNQPLLPQLQNHTTFCAQFALTGNKNVEVLPEELATDNPEIALA